MANNSAGVYDGLPFSYLTNTSPTEKQPPRSPRLSARSQSEKERGEPVGEARPSEEEVESRPFTYLTPNSPTERDRPSGVSTSSQPQYLEPLEEERGYERGPGSRELYNNPSFSSGQGHDNSRRLPREREAYPEKEVRVGSDPNYYTSIKDTDRNWDQERSRTAVHPQDRSRDYLAPDYKQGPKSDFELGGYASIPRPKIGGNSAETGVGNNNYKQEYQNDNNHRYDGMATANQKPRPLSRDSYLDPGIKRGHGCECRVVLITVFLVILALGAGFAAGWFVSKSVNSSSNSNTDEGDSSISSTTPLMAALTTSTPTTARPVVTTTTATAIIASTTTTTTETTTQQAAETQALDVTTVAKTTTLTETDQPSTTRNAADTTDSTIDAL